MSSALVSRRPEEEAWVLVRVRVHTLVLCCCLQAELHELKLVDLLCEALDEGLEERYPLLCTLWLVVVLDQLVGQLVPQLALPVVLKGDEVLLQLVGRLVAQVAEEVRDRVCVHGHGGWLCEWQWCMYVQAGPSQVRGRGSCIDYGGDDGARLQ